MTANISTHTRAICASICTLAIAGCTTTTILPPPPLADRIPSQLLECRDRPTVGDLARQSDVARWVVELDSAGEDCRRKNKAIAGIVESDRARTGEN
ncbi:hypothetical protein [Aurantimonas coralicida]|uniref:hypothetical protein n=1 Tax=Aurantimonas coralicida TaxID=182270 RepID=UPI00046277D3|nr:hypothetical protein [Aurantimonas coralicida]MCC4298453.1 hypothetical protein [Aurantimonas coralicida]